jgi:hypothetical protein
MAERELWKAIPELQGYEVSNLGRLRSLDRVVHYDYWKRVRGRIMSSWPNPSGHLMTNLGKKIGTQYVHQLVMLAFVGPCPKGKEVAHNDGDPSNNNISNLRYATRQENCEDRVKHGAAARGAQNGGSKLTEDAVLEIRKATKVVLVARKYGISMSQAYRIRKRECWGWLE